MVKEKKKIGYNEIDIELPEEAKKVLETMITNLVQDFLKQKEWQERSEGINN